MARNMYNPNGSINMSWLIEQEQQRCSNNTISDEAIDDIIDDVLKHRKAVTTNNIQEKYNEAFNFLKQHTSMTDEQIALTVIKIIR
ncbi:MAG: hypothetical protein IIT49_00400 [Clostridia bacterium]|nr:hypothetical protein [Clostridia bacterium]MBQ5439226.1 hypothetical protein [Clostridia bacterium]